MIRFVTAVSKTGSRIHCVDQSSTPEDSRNRRKAISLCHLHVLFSPEQEFVPEAIEVNCSTCCYRAAKRAELD